MVSGDDLELREEDDKWDWASEQMWYVNFSLSENKEQRIGFKLNLFWCLYYSCSTFTSEWEAFWKNTFYSLDEFGAKVVPHWPRQNHVWMLSLDVNVLGCWALVPSCCSEGQGTLN